MKRRASTVVEVAVVMPLLLTFLFGIIEYGWVLFAIQTAQHAAQEGARVGCLQTSDTTDISNKIAEKMGNLPYTEEIEDLPAQCLVNVKVIMRYEDISLTGGFLGDPVGNLTGRGTTMKEGCTPLTLHN